MPTARIMRFDSHHPTCWLFSTDWQRFVCWLISENKVSSLVYFWKKRWNCREFGITWNDLSFSSFTSLSTHIDESILCHYFGQSASAETCKGNKYDEIWLEKILKKQSKISFHLSVRIKFRLFGIILSYENCQISMTWKQCKCFSLNIAVSSHDASLARDTFRVLITQLEKHVEQTRINPAYLVSTISCLISGFPLPNVVYKALCNEDICQLKHEIYKPTSSTLHYKLEPVESYKHFFIFILLAHTIICFVVLAFVMQ